MVISYWLSVISSDKSDRSDGERLAHRLVIGRLGGWSGECFQLGEHGMPVSPRERILAIDEVPPAAAGRAKPFVGWWAGKAEKGKKSCRGMGIVL